MVISQPPPTAGGMTVPPPSMMGSVQKPPPNLVPGMTSLGGHQQPGMTSLGGHQQPGMTSLGGHQHQLAVPSAQAVGTPIIGPDGSIIDYDGKRLRKTMMRKTIDYNSSFVNMLNNRIWQRDHRDRRAVQPDITHYPSIEPPQALKNEPVNAITSRFVKTATNKMRCPIFCLSWTPEGRRLITGASSGEFTLWNGLTFNFETILQAHDSPVRAMKWSYNSQWMVTGDHGGYIKYWQSNMNNVKMFQAHKEPVRQVSFSPTDTKFASCSDDGTVRIWDFQKCYEERVLRGHGADVKCVDWHPQKGLVVSGSKDNQQPLKLWDPRTGSVLSTIHAHKSTVMDCSWNKNGNWLITASRDHLLKLFDIRNMKEEVRMFRGHKKEASAVSWHPVHQNLFTSGGSDGAIIFWNVNQDKEIGVIENAHESIVWTLVWHPIGHILTTGSNDHTVKFWSRNRPGDTMRDKYNLNTIVPPVEDDNGNLCDLGRGGLSTVSGGGEQPSALFSGGSLTSQTIVKSEIKSFIPGLDVQVDEEETPDVKPGIRPLPGVASIIQQPDIKPPWADKTADQRGTKRLYGERETLKQEAPMSHMAKPFINKEQSITPGSDQGAHVNKAITLSQLQQEATAVVAQGQIIPVLPGSSLYQSIAAGEMSIRDVLIRDFNLGRRNEGTPPIYPPKPDSQFTGPGGIPGGNPYRPGPGSTPGYPGDNQAGPPGIPQPDYNNQGPNYHQQSYPNPSQRQPREDSYQHQQGRKQNWGGGGYRGGGRGARN